MENNDPISIKCQPFHMPQSAALHFLRIHVSETMICFPASPFFPFYYNYMLIFFHCTHCKKKKMMMEEQEEEEKFL